MTRRLATARISLFSGWTEPILLQVADSISAGRRWRGVCGEFGVLSVRLQLAVDVDRRVSSEQRVAIRSDEGVEVGSLESFIH